MSEDVIDKMKIKGISSVLSSEFVAYEQRGRDEIIPMKRAQDLAEILIKYAETPIKGSMYLYVYHTQRGPELILTTMEDEHSSSQDSVLCIMELFPEGEDE